MIHTTIAVAGERGSFSHQAAHVYALGHDIDLDTIEVVYAIDSAGALDALSTGSADTAIIPVYNTIGGLVQMTLHAMGQHLFQIDEWFEMNIEQCIMKLPDAELGEMMTVASHPQALKQCAEYLYTNYPKLTRLEYQDTAKAAADLASGTLSPDTLVIAPKLSAELYGLELLAEGMQDTQDNRTTFLVLKNR